MPVRSPAELQAPPCREGPIDCFLHLLHPSLERAVRLVDTIRRQVCSFVQDLRHLRIFALIQIGQDPQQQASAEIDEAILSREEILDIPMELQTQYFKKTREETEVSVLTRLNVKDIHFRMVDKWNCNKLTIVTAVFDNNGNFIFGA
jgi:hypothetical protein